jgi:xanthosine utilization system XapX-like protein
MLNRIFPKQFDNNFCGHRFAIWVFILVVLARLAMATNSVINTRFVAAGADGIPLEAYKGGGADAVVALFALVGFLGLLLALQAVIVLIRYRSMIPFMFLLFLAAQIGGRVIGYVHPVARSGVSSAQLGSTFVIAITAMTIVGFVLSLLNKSSSAAPDNSTHP